METQIIQNRLFGKLIQSLYPIVGILLKFAFANAVKSIAIPFKKRYGSPWVEETFSLVFLEYIWKG